MKIIVSILYYIFCLTSFSLSFDYQAYPELSDLRKDKHLPSPFIALNGRVIDTPAKWNVSRREELKEMFQHYMFGYFPKNLELEFKTVKEVSILNGKALYKEVLIEFKDFERPFNFIRLSIFLPKSKEKVPLFLAINKCGNKTVLERGYVTVDDDLYMHPKSCSRFMPVLKSKMKKGIWPVQKILEKGYGVATFSESYMDADRNHHHQDGIHGQLYPLMRPQHALGTLGAWALGIMKSMDYLVMDSKIDAQKIAVVGHSRRGKAALVAGAFDDRIALVAPVQSGLGGTAPMRRALFRESARMIIKGGFLYEKLIGEREGLSHFFTPEFHLFSKSVNRLPIDQNLLISLVAPRPLINVQGAYDFWAGPKASYNAMKNANKVYTFLGEQGFIGEGKIKNNEIIDYKTAGRLLHYTAETGHVFNDHYWMRILDFADTHLKIKNK